MLFDKSNTIEISQEMLQFFGLRPVFFYKCTRLQGFISFPANIIILLFFMFIATQLRNTTPLIILQGHFELG